MRIIIVALLSMITMGCQQSEIPLCSMGVSSNEPCRVAMPSKMRQKLEYMAYH